MAGSMVTEGIAVVRVEMGTQNRSAIGYGYLSKNRVAGVLGELEESGDAQMKPNHRVEMISVRHAMAYNNRYNGDMDALMACDCSPDRSRQSFNFLG